MFTGFTISKVILEILFCTHSEYLGAYLVKTDPGVSKDDLHYFKVNGEMVSPEEK